MKQFRNMVTFVGLVLAGAALATGFALTNVEFAKISRSTLDSSPIGALVPSTGAFTTLSNTTGGGTITDTFIGNLTGNVTGNVSGNAGTATALAAAPSNCGSAANTNIFAYGISANGAALCSGLTFQAMSITTGLCTTSGSETTCISPSSGVYNWPTAFASNAYVVACNYVNQPTGTGTHPGLLGPYIVAQTAAGIAFNIQSGSNAAGGNNTVGGVNCIAIGAHA